MGEELAMLARALEMAQPGAGQALASIQDPELLDALIRVFVTAERQQPGAGPPAVVQALMQLGLVPGAGAPAPQMAPPPDQMGAPPMPMQGGPPPGMAPPMDPGVPPEMAGGAPTQAPPEPQRAPVKIQKKKQGPPKYENPPLEPNKYAKKAPTIERIYQVARAGETIWAANRLRKKEAVACWKGEMTSYQLTASGAMQETYNPARAVHQRLTPFSYVERVTTMVSWNNDTEMDLPPRADDDEHTEAAQKSENWSRTMREMDSKRWRRRGELGDPQPPLERVEAQGMTLLGGVGWMWEIRPEDKTHPYRCKYIPWTELYPVGNEITRQYTVPLGQLRAECEEAEEYYKGWDGDDNLKCKVIGWSDNQGYRHALVWDQEGSGWDGAPTKDDNGNEKERWIKKPTKVLGLGFPFYNLAIAVSEPGGNEDELDGRKWVGMGILDRAIPHFRMVNMVGEFAMKGFFRNVDPPTFQTHMPGTDLNKVPTIDLEPGSRNFGFQQDKVETLGANGTGTPDGSTTLSMLSADQADLVPPVMAGQRAGNSGFQQMQTENAANAVTVGPIMDAMEKMYQDQMAQRLSLALRFAKNADNKDLEYFNEYPYKNYRGGNGSYGSLKATDIERSGVDVEVRYKRLSFAEENAQAQMLVSLVNAHLMSTEEALKRRGVREPEREWLKILKDGALMNPRVLMGLVGKAIMESGDQMLIEEWQNAGMLEALKGGGGSPPAATGVASAAGTASPNMPADVAQPGASNSYAA